MDKESANKEFGRVMKKNEFVDELYENTVGHEDVEHARVDKHVFVREFLPHLIDSENNDGVAATWVQIAGSPFNQVDLIENGEVVDIVPPLMIRPELKQDGKVLPMNDIATTYNQKQERLPAEAEAYMGPVANAVGQRVDLEQNGLKTQWGSLAKRCGLDVNVEETGTEDSNDDYFDYD